MQIKGKLVSAFIRGSSLAPLGAAFLMQVTDDLETRQFSSSWGDVRERYNKQAANFENKKMYALWLGELDEMKGRPASEQTAALDALIDRTVRCVDTPAPQDRWATPIETLSRGWGNPQDRAVLRGVSLYQLDLTAIVPQDGWPGRAAKCAPGR